MGGASQLHHMPGFSRRSDWHEYFDQRFDGAYQDQLSRGQDVSDFQWADGFPLNGLASVKALTQPPKNPVNSTGGLWVNQTMRPVTDE